MKKVNSARCPACRDKEESPEHFMLHCLSYTHERWALMQQASKLCRPLTMELLLGAQEMARTLAKYIRATNRFEKSSLRVQT